MGCVEEESKTRFRVFSFALFNSDNKFFVGASAALRKGLSPSRSISQTGTAFYLRLIDASEKGWKSCSNCKYFLKLRPTPGNLSASDARFSSWCGKNDYGTTPLSLRCGGDDWEIKNDP